MHDLQIQITTKFGKTKSINTLLEAKYSPQGLLALPHQIRI